MPIVYPRPMPDVGASSVSFEPAGVDYMSPETGARIGAIAAGWTLWRMKVSLANMRTPDADLWRAWVATLRGSRRLLLGRDLSRPGPRFHAGGIPFGPQPSGWSQTITGEGDGILQLAGLQRGAVISVGDYIGFKWDAAGEAAGSFGRRALVRACEKAKVGADGVAVMTVEPPVHNIVPAGAKAHLDEPACLMRIVTSSTQLGEQVLGDYTSSGGAIEAVQDLLP
jgi:hypothetical protein